MADSKGNAVGSFLVILCLIVILVLLFGGSCKCSPSSSNEFNPTTAISQVQLAIPDQLKSPSSLKFIGTAKVEKMTNPESQYQDMKIDSENLWIVSGEFDAQNSFGALIRTKYLAVVEFNPDKGYRIIAITLD